MTPQPGVGISDLRPPGPGRLEPERVSVVFGAVDWKADVEALTAVLGPPSLSQDGEWAQFDSGETRVCVGVRADVPPAALMLKVDDVVAAGRLLRRHGWDTGEMLPGQHELRLYATHRGGLHLVVYQAWPAVAELVEER